MISTNKYLAGEHPLESYRLAAKTPVEQFVARYLKPHLVPNMRVLDVGGGPGVMAREVARTVSDSVVYSLDASPARTKAAEECLDDLIYAHAILGNAYQLPFPDDSFDLIYTRFVLQHLPNPDQVVAEMTRVCKPGGRLLLQDTDGYNVTHYPKDERLQTIIHKVIQCLEKSGFDPYTGRKLYHWCQQLGLLHVDVTIQSHNLIAGCISEQALQFLKMEFEVANNTFLEAFGSQDTADDAKRYFYEYSQRADTLSFGTLFTVTGIKPIQV